MGPALGGRDREENLRSVLTSVEANREVLDLGLSINDCIKKRDYPALADAYARAQRHVKDAQSTVDKASTNSVKLNDQQVYQIVFTARVWMDIEQSVTQFKKEIRTTLNNSFPRNDPGPLSGRDEDPSELIGVLLQLGVDENPISSWLLNWSSHLSDKISTVAHSCRLELEVLRRRLAASKPPTNKRLALYMRVCADPKAKEDLTRTDTVSVIRFWERLTSAINTIASVQDGILAEVIEFWETSQSYIDGKRQRGLPVGADGRGRQHHQLPKDTVSELQRIAISLFGQIREQISSIFVDPPPEDLTAMLSPIPLTPRSGNLTPSAASTFSFNREELPPPSPKIGEHWEHLAFWPPHSNSNCGGAYLSRIVNLIASAAADIAAIPLVKQDAKFITKVRLLVSDVRERSINAVCFAWGWDSEHCRELEDWVKSPEKRDVTMLPARLYAF